MDQGTPLPPDAAFELRFEHRPGYLYAHVSGSQDSLAIRLAFWNEVAAEVRRTQTQSLLVLDDLQGPPPQIDVLARVIHEMKGKGLEGVRIAYIEPDAAFMSLMEMAEVIARESGFLPHVFGDEEEACAGCATDRSRRPELPKPNARS
jgi:hypothetical protein